MANINQHLRAIASRNAPGSIAFRFRRTSTPPASRPWAKPRLPQLHPLRQLPPAAPTTTRPRPRITTPRRRLRTARTAPRRRLPSARLLARPPRPTTALSRPRLRSCLSLAPPTSWTLLPVASWLSWSWVSSVCLEMSFKRTWSAQYLRPQEILKESSVVEGIWPWGSAVETNGLDCIYFGTDTALHIYFTETSLLAFQLLQTLYCKVKTWHHQFILHYLGGISFESTSRADTDKEHYLCRVRSAHVNSARGHRYSYSCSQVTQEIVE